MYFCSSSVQILVLSITAYLSKSSDTKFRMTLFNSAELDLFTRLCEPLLRFDFVDSSTRLVVLSSDCSEKLHVENDHIFSLKLVVLVDVKHAVEQDTLLRHVSSHNHRHEPEKTRPIDEHLIFFIQSVPKPTSHHFE